MRVLEDAQLITHEQQGRGRLYKINQKKLKVIQEWLDWFDRKE